LQLARGTAEGFDGFANNVDTHAQSVAQSGKLVDVLNIHVRIVTR